MYLVILDPPHAPIIKDNGRLVGFKKHMYIMIYSDLDRINTGKCVIKQKKYQTWLKTKKDLVNLRNFLYL